MSSSEEDKVTNMKGGFIRRQVDETDAEFSNRVGRIRAGELDELKSLRESEIVKESPLDKFKRLWS